MHAMFFQSFYIPTIFGGNFFFKNIDDDLLQSFVDFHSDFNLCKRNIFLKKSLSNTKRINSEC